MVKIKQTPVILIVDDNQSNLKLLSVILRNLEAKVVTAQSGAEALKLMEGKSNIALAILDIMMPGMDGIELASIIQQLPGDNQIPVIFITAHTRDDEELNRCYEVGAADFILKPFSNKIVQAKVKVFLELFRRQQMISEQNLMFRAMLNSSPSGIAVMDLSGQITEVSDSFCEIFKCEDQDEYIGSDFHQLFPVSETKNIRSMIRKAKKEGLAQMAETVITPKNNQQVILEVTITTIQDVNRNKHGLMGILRDISRRRKMEQQLMRSERMISLGGMASAMAHEINQPLLSISLGLDNMLLKLKKLNNVDQPYFIKKSESIFGDITRIGRIIDHVKAFSRIQTEEVLTSFNVNDSIKNAVSMIAEQFRHHSVQIEIEYDEHLPPVKGDTYMFEQVILNLLNNAKDAMEEKARRSGKFQRQISISTYHKGNCNYVKVSDNGTGIKSKDIDNIMLPFFTTKKVGKGTGLGLSISYSIIKEFNGSIEVENISPSKGSAGRSSGTCFVISIPV